MKLVCLENYLPAIIMDFFILWRETGNLYLFKIRENEYDHR